MSDAIPWRRVGTARVWRRGGSPSWSDGAGHGKARQGRSLLQDGGKEWGQKSKFGGGKCKHIGGNDGMAKEAGQKAVKKIKATRQRHAAC